jgi:hypothetical protein
MALPANPLEAIFPLIIGTRIAPVLGRRFIGTGFYVAPDGAFLTAGHVIDDIELADDESVWVLNLSDLGVRACPVRDWCRSPATTSEAVLPTRAGAPFLCR